jgi:hypothetical protein
MRPYTVPRWRLAPTGGSLQSVLRVLDPAERRVMLRSLSLDAWIPVETTRLTPRPSNPALAAL